MAKRILVPLDHGTEYEVILPVVADLEIKYRSSAKLDDDLVVLSEVIAVRAASCAIHQRVMRGTAVLADARVTAAFVAGGRPKRQPRAWVEIFQRLTEEGD